jgi:hypothetical protein
MKGGAAFHQKTCGTMRREGGEKREKREEGREKRVEKKGDERRTTSVKNIQTYKKTQQHKKDHKKTSAAAPTPTPTTLRTKVMNDVVDFLVTTYNFMTINLT